MKIRFITLSLGVLVSCTTLMAQVVSKDSIQLLEKQKDAIELSKEVNDKKTELAKLQNDLEKKNNDVRQLAEKADQSARENQQAASRLSSNAQDKKLANQARSTARRAERDAKAARKAAENQISMQEKIAKLQTEISENESKIASSAVGINSSASVISSSAAVNNSGSGQTQSYGVQGAPSQKDATNQQAYVISNPVTPSSTDPQKMQNASVQGITERVIESTYKNYPQQQGQPSIIINNIIIPSDYQRPEEKRGDRQAHKSPAMQDDVKIDQDYENFLRWKKERSNSVRNFSREQEERKDLSQREEVHSTKQTFKERFGEMPQRKSGLWVIPMVGVHASGFEADFSNSEAEGRTGWNAGLDFRFHAKRFFIQPGVHYFNSSLRFTSKDSLSSAPLLDGPRIHSLKVPVMLGVYLTKANSGFFKFNIKGGATGNYVIAVDKDAKSIFQKDDIEEYSYGLAAGIGLEFGLITLDLSHEWGMSSFLKNSDLKNNVLRATIGLKL